MSTLHEKTLTQAARPVEGFFAGLAPLERRKIISSQMTHSTSITLLVSSVNARAAEQSVEPEPRTMRFQYSASTARGPVNAVVLRTIQFSAYPFLEFLRRPQFRLQHRKPVSVLSAEFRDVWC